MQGEAYYSLSAYATELPGQFASRSVSTLNNHEIVLAADGSFEVRVCPPAFSAAFLAVSQFSSSFSFSQQFSLLVIFPFHTHCPIRPSLPTDPFSLSLHLALSLESRSLARAQSLSLCIAHVRRFLSARCAPRGR